MNYFGLFFSFMVPSVILGFMIAAACLQERAIRRRTQRTRHSAARSNSKVRSYSAARKSEHTNAVKSDKTKLYIYDMSAA